MTLWGPHENTTQGMSYMQIEPYILIYGSIYILIYIFGVTALFIILTAVTHMLHYDTVESTFLNLVYLGLSNVLEVFSW